MNSQENLPPNQNQILSLLANNNSFIEPNIRQAKFIVSKDRGRIYTLDFDQNIQMIELKTMIGKAAHLRKNSFSIFSEGENYTQYNEETFDSLFPDKQLVVFTLELLDSSQSSDETEFLLQINMPCPEHNCKFLLYYCFDCGKSICSECFTNGLHKGHKIQDKCFYLLPSKYLVEKMLENWSQNPYDEFKISVDLNEYKNRLNKKIFAELFQLLQEVQNKCNNLIDKYNQINEKSLNNIRDSVRDIKVYCIRALDEYKKAINIKDIINNEEMFIDFDKTYKELGIQQKEKFKENLQKFQELNKSISLLVQNLIDDICQRIKDSFLLLLNNKEYESIENKINMKLIRPLDKEQIMNQISDKKNKIKNKKYDRRTISNFKKISNNISDNAFDIQKNINNKNIETAKGRHTMNMDVHTSINSNINNSLDKIDNDINMKDSMNNSYDKNISMVSNNNNNGDYLASNGRSNRINLFNEMNRNNINSNINFNSNVNKVNYSIDSFPNKSKENKLLDANNTNINISNTHILNDRIAQPSQNMHGSVSQNIVLGPSSKTQIKIPQPNINQGYNQAINSNNFNNFNNQEKTGINIQINEPEKHVSNVFASILKNNESKNDININDNNSNVFDTTTNKKDTNTININSMNNISPILENRACNQNNSNQSNNSSFNHDINNLNAATFLNKDTIEISNPFGNNNMNNKPSKNKILSNDINTHNNMTIKITTQPNKASSNITLASPFSHVQKTINNTNIIETNNDSDSGINNNNNVNVKNFTNDNVNNIFNQTGVSHNNTRTNININFGNNINDSNNNNNKTNTINTKITQIQTQEVTHPNQNNNLNLASVIAQKIMNTQYEIDNNNHTMLTKNNFNPILEEAGESESELKRKGSESKTIPIQYYLNKPFILCPISGTNKLKIITDEETDESTISITFPKEIGFNVFLKDCAYCNYNRKLYVSGGIIEEDDNNIFSSKKLLVVDLFQKDLEGKNSFITELHPMSFPKYKHSMIGIDDKIYVVGGENSDVVERFDIKTNKWELLNPLIKKRSYPNLFFYEGYLYACFGKEEEEYLKNIERLNLDNAQFSAWEIILFENLNNVDVRIYGCGIYQVDELIYFFGGKCLDEDTDEIFFINMKDKIIDRTDAKLMWKESFRENTLFQLGNKLVQISDEKYYGTYLKVIIQ